MSGDRASDFKWISWSIPCSNVNQSEIASSVYKSCRCSKKRSFDHQQEANLKYSNHKKNSGVATPMLANLQALNFFLLKYN